MARVALVTGGTRGIGAAISKALKAAGYATAAIAMAMVSVAALGASVAPAHAAGSCASADDIPTASTAWQAMR